MTGAKEDTGGAARPAIFERYPELEGAIPWLPLGTYPTPVHRLTSLGGGRLWIKRDDLTSPEYGGNKVRKLEFILGDAVRRGKKRVVTIGGIGTNHGLATAIYCRKLGIGCTLALFDQPVTGHVRENLLLFHRYGAELVHSASMFGAGSQFYIFQRMRRPGSCFVYAGGSTPLGAIGFVSAAFELKKQIDEGMLPEPRYIFCPLGSSGTMAGLALGARIAGMTAEVIGVRVTASSLGPIPLATPQTVATLMAGAYRLLKNSCPSLPNTEICRPRVIDEFFGGEYGLPTAEGNRAQRLFRDQEGIILDSTYTAKTCAALLDFMKDPWQTKEPVLYWHTYNSRDMSAEAASVQYRDLPRDFHRFFSEPHIL